MEQITQCKGVGSAIRNKVTKKKKKKTLNLLSLKNPSLFLEGLHQGVMSSHPNLSTSCCQSLGALTKYVQTSSSGGAGGGLPSGLTVLLGTFRHDGDHRDGEKADG